VLAPGSARQAPLHRVKAAIPGQYIVSLAPGSDPVAVARTLGVTPRHVYRNAMLGFAGSLTALQVTRARTTPAVRSVEEDGRVTIPPDERAGTFPRSRAGSGIPWGLERINHREPGGTGFSVRATGARVTSYIIDSGIDYTHQEFGGRAVYGTDQIDDGREGTDCAGHGTHVAGTVGGATTGVARQTTLVSVRVLNCDNRGTNSSIIAGVNWVAANARKPAVANLSLGGPWSYALNSSIDGLSRSGVFTVVAAGNDNVNACITSPASAPEAFTVAAIGQTDGKASFSNYGSCVNVNAPGVAITSAYLDGTYTDMNGTSMAAPHVTGIAALYKDTYGDVPSSALAKWLTDNATGGVPAVAPWGTPQLLAYTAGL
jgi:subtilisin family serine protease